MLPKFQIDDNTWVTLPNRIITKNPTTLKVQYIEDDVKFTSLNDFATKELYIQEDTEAMRKMLFYPRRQQEVINEIVFRSTAGYTSHTNFDLLLSTDHFKTATKKYLANIYGKFVKFGTFSAGMIGIYMIFMVLKLVLTQFLTAYHLFSIFGLSYKVLAGCIPFLAKFLILKKHHNNLNELKRKIATTEEVECDKIEEERVLAKPNHINGSSQINQ